MVSALLRASVRLGRWMACVLIVFAIASPGYAQESRLLITVTANDHDGDRWVRYPLSGATIRVTHRQDGALVKTGTTDGLGNAEIIVPSLREWGYVVAATLDGYEPDNDYGILGAEIWPPPGDVAVGVSLRVITPKTEPEIDRSPNLPEGRIFGRIVLTDGTPMPLTQVEARGERWYRTTLTAEDGSFTLRLLPDVYTIHSPGVDSVADNRPRAARPGTYPLPVGVEARHITGPVDLVLEPLRLFHVTVIVTNDLGDRVSDANVDNLIGNKDGVLVLGPYPPGTKRTMFINGRIGNAEFAGITSFEVQDADQDVTVTLARAASLTGRVEFANRSTPLHSGSGLQVIARHPDDAARGSNAAPDSRKGLIDADGWFTLTGLIGPMCLDVVGLPYPADVRVTRRGSDVTNKVLNFESGEDQGDLLIRIERRDGSFEAPPRCKP